jgi:hypothetical protein
MAFLDYVHCGFVRIARVKKTNPLVSTTVKATPPRFPETLGIACALPLHLVVECVPLLEGLT